MKPLGVPHRLRFLLRSSVIGCFLFLTVATQNHGSAQTFDNPDAAAANEDFAVQGEYAGNQRGLQVVARGSGEFEIVIFEGGLPGAGWDRVNPRRIDGDADTVADLVESMELKKVERTSPTLGAAPPEDAVVLFDGTAASLNDHWKPGAKITADGLLQQGATSTDTFHDYTLHAEFRTPFMPAARGQGRGNSGIYHQGRYETQVLDSFGLKGENNESGGIYTVRAPDLNMCLPPLQWQTYDVDFTAPRFDDSGKKISDARLTVRLNGVVVQPDVAAPRTTTAAPLRESAQPGPIYIQDHGNPVRYRNIWVLPRDAEKEARRPRVPGFERLYAAGTGDAVEAGHLLISSLACNACHAGDSALPTKQGPNLTNVATRVRADHLLAMIADPHRTKPGTTMPDPWSGTSEADQDRLSRAIASYLKGNASVNDRPGDTKAAQRGDALYHSIGCVACHDSMQDKAPKLATSVPLGNLSQKYTLDSLTQFLLDPHAVRAGGRMPKLVADGAEARDVACYLLRDIVLVPGGESFTYKLYKGSWDKLPVFADLEPAESGMAKSLDVMAYGLKENFGLVFETYLPVSTPGEFTFTIGSDDGSRLLVNDKAVVTHDGIHPHSNRSGKVKLPAGTHKLTIEYFEKTGEESLAVSVDGPDMGGAELSALVTSDPEGKKQLELVPSTFVADASLMAEGAAAFASQGCVNCHQLDRDGAAPKTMHKPLVELASVATQGCLSESPAEGLPNYELSPTQRSAIVAALTAADQVIPPATQTRLTLAAMNCVACHERDGVGGPETVREAWFQTTTPEMGNEGRLPPTLTGAGDKLNDAYVALILDNGANERPYMKTRMPAFRYEPLKALHAHINDLDRRTEVTIPDDAKSPTLTISNGRKLIGEKGLSCVKCHTYDGVGVEGIRALDALKMPQRLREDWFHRYLMDPQKYRPGTRMPVSFVDGKSAITDIYDGDPARQIDAMWKYLSAEKPKPPQGLIQGAIVLTPQKRPIIYRNFLTDVSPRGIAVGYPEGVNMAWDAHTMGLVKMWQNDFIDASKHWVGRGPGNQAPLGDAVVFVDRHSPFAVLPTADAPWPKQPAREQGAKFLGYRLNELGQPIFRYAIAGNAIEEFCQPLGGQPQQRGFQRTWTVTADQPTNDRTLRLAAGQIAPQPDGSYRVSGGPLVTVAGDTKPKLVDVDGGQELRWNLPKANNVTVSATFQW